MRCAAYLRTSTDDMQSPEESARWQIRAAEGVIAGHGGVIVAKYHDQGVSRSVPWSRRPEATRLIADLARTPADRGWDVVVIGEPQRAFHGNQFGLTYPLFTHHGVQLWVPEVGGPIDPDSEVHDLIMVLFGGLSKAETNRLAARVRGQMGAMVANKTGRFLGGRPPYGYLLERTGVLHPNPEKARQGVELTALVPDPVTADVVRLMFRLRAQGMGTRAIAERLTDLGYLWPSAYDEARNTKKNRPAPMGWSRDAIRAMLENPRYRGTDRFGHYRRVKKLMDPADVAAGTVSRMTIQPEERWILAENVIPPLVTPEEWAATQRPVTRRGPRPDRPGPHGYALRGLFSCDACGRRMEGHTAKRVAGTRVLYRCRAKAHYPATDHPDNIYIAEARVLPALDGWLADLFAPDRIEATVEAIMAEAGQEQGEAPAIREARQTAVATRKLMARHIAAIEAGVDPTVLAPKIKAAQVALAQAEAVLASQTETPSLSPEAVRNLLTDGEALPALLAVATPDERRRIYSGAGISLAYKRSDNGTESVKAALSVGFWCVGEGT